jgi:hypothetical protein
MERNCLYCEIPIDKKKHGLVKFCSTQCRNKYYYQNKQVREIHDSEKNSNNNNQFIQNTLNEKQGNNLSGYSSQKQVIPENNNEWRGNISDSSRGVLANDVIRFMEENFKTKAELVASELKLENALKEINDLKLKNAELESELEEDEEDEQVGILGAINQIPEWLQPALAGILKSDKVQNFIIGLIPEKETA